MADNTPSSGSLMRPWRSPWGAFPSRAFPENDASTFYAGHLVEQSTQGSTASGKIQTMSSLSTRIVGVAAEKASSTADTDILVWEANPMVEFRGFAKGTLASSNLGASYSFAYDSSLGIHYVDLANSSAADVRCIVTDFITGSAGDTNGEVAFRFRTTDDAEASTRSRVLAYYR